MTMFPPSPEQVTETLTRLDWSPTCEAPDCATTADMFLMFTPCGHTHLVCADHARHVAQQHRGAPSGCSRCGATVHRVWPRTIPGENRT